MGENLIIFYYFGRKKVLFENEQLLVFALQIVYLEFLALGGFGWWVYLIKLV